MASYVEDQFGMGPRHTSKKPRQSHRREDDDADSENDATSAAYPSAPSATTQYYLHKLNPNFKGRVATVLQHASIAAPNQNQANALHSGTTAGSPSATGNAIFSYSYSAFLLFAVASLDRLKDKLLARYHNGAVHRRSDGRSLSMAVAASMGLTSASSSPAATSTTNRNPQSRSQQQQAAASKPSSSGRLADAAIARRTALWESRLQAKISRMMTYFQSLLEHNEFPIASTEGGVNYATLEFMWQRAAEEALTKADGGGTATTTVDFTSLFSDVMKAALKSLKGDSLNLADGTKKRDPLRGGDLPSTKQSSRQSRSTSLADTEEQLFRHADLSGTDTEADSENEADDLRFGEDEDDDDGEENPQAPKFASKPYFLNPSSMPPVQQGNHKGRQWDREAMFEDHFAAAITRSEFASLYNNYSLSLQAAAAAHQAALAAAQGGATPGSRGSRKNTSATPNRSSSGAATSISSSIVDRKPFVNVTSLRYLMNVCRIITKMLRADLTTERNVSSSVLFKVANRNAEIELAAALRQQKDIEESKAKQERRRNGRRGGAAFDDADEEGATANSNQEEGNEDDIMWTSMDRSVVTFRPLFVTLGNRSTFQRAILPLLMTLMDVAHSRASYVEFWHGVLMDQVRQSEDRALERGELEIGNSSNFSFLFDDYVFNKVQRNISLVAYRRWKTYKAQQERVGLLVHNLLQLLASYTLPIPAGSPNQSQQMELVTNARENLLIVASPVSNKSLSAATHQHHQQNNFFTKLIRFVAPMAAKRLQWQNEKELLLARIARQVQVQNGQQLSGQYSSQGSTIHSDIHGATRASHSLPVGLQTPSRAGHHNRQQHFALAGADDYKQENQFTVHKSPFSVLSFSSPNRVGGGSTKKSQSQASESAASSSAATFLSMASHRRSTSKALSLFCAEYFRSGSLHSNAQQEQETDDSSNMTAEAGAQSKSSSKAIVEHRIKQLHQHRAAAMATALTPLDAALIEMALVILVHSLRPSASSFLWGVAPTSGPQEGGEVGGDDPEDGDDGHTNGSDEESADSRHEGAREEFSDDDENEFYDNDDDNFLSAAEAKARAGGMDVVRNSAARKRYAAAKKGKERRQQHDDNFNRKVGGSGKSASAAATAHQALQQQSGPASLRQRQLHERVLQCLCRCHAVEFLNVLLQQNYYDLHFYVSERRRCIIAGLELQRWQKRIQLEEEGLRVPVRDTAYRANSNTGAANQEMPLESELLLLGSSEVPPSAHATSRARTPPNIGVSLHMGTNTLPPGYTNTLLVNNSSESAISLTPVASEKRSVAELLASPNPSAILQSSSSIGANNTFPATLVVNNNNTFGSQLRASSRSVSNMPFRGTSVSLSRRDYVTADGKIVTTVVASSSGDEALVGASREISVRDSLFPSRPIAPTLDDTLTGRADSNSMGFDTDGAATTKVRSKSRPSLSIPRADDAEGAEAELVIAPSATAAPPIRIESSVAVRVDLHDEVVVAEGLPDFAALLANATAAAEAVVLEDEEDDEAMAEQTAVAATDDNDDGDLLLGSGEHDKKMSKNDRNKSRRKQEDREDDESIIGSDEDDTESDEEESAGSESEEEEVEELSQRRQKRKANTVGRTHEHFHSSQPYTPMSVNDTLRALHRWNFYVLDALTLLYSAPSPPLPVALPPMLMASTATTSSSKVARRALDAAGVLSELGLSSSKRGRGRPSAYAAAEDGPMAGEEDLDDDEHDAAQQPPTLSTLAYVASTVLGDAGTSTANPYLFQLQQQQQATTGGLQLHQQQTKLFTFASQMATFTIDNNLRQLLAEAKTGLTLVMADCGLAPQQSLIAGNTSAKAPTGASSVSTNYHAAATFMADQQQLDSWRTVAKATHGVGSHSAAILVKRAAGSSTAISAQPPVTFNDLAATAQTLSSGPNTTTSFGNNKTTKGEVIGTALRLMPSVIRREEIVAVKLEDLSGLNADGPLTDGDRVAPLRLPQTLATPSNEEAAADQFFTLAHRNALSALDAGRVIDKLKRPMHGKKRFLAEGGASDLAASGTGEGAGAGSAAGGAVSALMNTSAKGAGTNSVVLSAAEGVGPSASAVASNAFNRFGSSAVIAEALGKLLRVPASTAIKSYIGDTKSNASVPSDAHKLLLTALQSTVTDQIARNLMDLLIPRLSVVFAPSPSACQFLSSSSQLLQALSAYAGYVASSNISSPTQGRQVLPKNSSSKVLITFGQFYPLFQRQQQLITSQLTDGKSAPVALPHQQFVSAVSAGTVPPSAAPLSSPILLMNLTSQLQEHFLSVDQHQSSASSDPASPKPPSSLEHMMSLLWPSVSRTIDLLNDALVYGNEETLYQTLLKQDERGRRMKAMQAKRKRMAELKKQQRAAAAAAAANGGDGGDLGNGSSAFVDDGGFDDMDDDGLGDEDPSAPAPLPRMSGASPLEDCIDKLGYLAGALGSDYRNDDDGEDDGDLGEEGAALRNASAILKGNRNDGEGSDDSDSDEKIDAAATAATAGIANPPFAQITDVIQFYQLCRQLLSYCCELFRQLETMIVNIEGLIRVVQVLSVKQPTAVTSPKPFSPPSDEDDDGTSTANTQSSFALLQAQLNAILNAASGLYQHHWSTVASLLLSPDHVRRTIQMAELFLASPRLQSQYDVSIITQVLTSMLSLLADLTDDFEGPDGLAGEDEVANVFGVFEQRQLEREAAQRFGESDGEGHASRSPAQQGPSDTSSVPVSPLLQPRVPLRVSLFKKHFARMRADHLANEGAAGFEQALEEDDATDNDEKYHRNSPTQKIAAYVSTLAITRAHARRLLLPQVNSATVSTAAHTLINDVICTQSVVRLIFRVVRNNVAAHAQHAANIFGLHDSSDLVGRVVGTSVSGDQSFDAVTMLLAAGKGTRGGKGRVAQGSGGQVYATSFAAFGTAAVSVLLLDAFFALMEKKSAADARGFWAVYDAQKEARLQVSIRKAERDKAMAERAERRRAREEKEAAERQKWLASSQNHSWNEEGEEAAPPMQLRQPSINSDVDLPDFDDVGMQSDEGPILSIRDAPQVGVVKVVSVGSAFAADAERRKLLMEELRGRLEIRRGTEDVTTTTKFHDDSDNTDEEGEEILNDDSTDDDDDAADTHHDRRRNADVKSRDDDGEDDDNANNFIDDSEVNAEKDRRRKKKIQRQQGAVSHDEVVEVDADELAQQLAEEEAVPSTQLLVGVEAPPPMIQLFGDAAAQPQSQAVEEIEREEDENIPVNQPSAPHSVASSLSSSSSRESSRPASSARSSAHVAPLPDGEDDNVYPTMRVEEEHNPVEVYQAEEDVSNTNKNRFEKDEQVHHQTHPREEEEGRQSAPQVPSAVPHVMVDVSLADLSQALVLEATYIPMWLSGLKLWRVNTCDANLALANLLWRGIGARRTSSEEIDKTEDDLLVVGAQAGSIFDRLVDVKKRLQQIRMRPAKPQAPNASPHPLWTAPLMLAMREVIAYGEQRYGYVSKCGKGFDTTNHPSPTTASRNKQATTPSSSSSMTNQHDDTSKLMLGEAMLGLFSVSEGETNTVANGQHQLPTVRRSLVGDNDEQEELAIKGLSWIFSPKNSSNNGAKHNNETPLTATSKSLSRHDDGHRALYEVCDEIVFRFFNPSAFYAPADPSSSSCDPLQEQQAKKKAEAEALAQKSIDDEKLRRTKLYESMKQPDDSLDDFFKMMESEARQTTESTDASVGPMATPHEGVQVKMEANAPDIQPPSQEANAATTTNNITVKSEFGQTAPTPLSSSNNVHQHDPDYYLRVELALRCVRSLCYALTSDDFDDLERVSMKQFAKEEIARLYNQDATAQKQQSMADRTPVAANAAAPAVPTESRIGKETREIKLLMRAQVVDDSKAINTLKAALRREEAEAAALLSNAAAAQPPHTSNDNDDDAIDPSAQPQTTHSISALAPEIQKGLDMARRVIAREEELLAKRKAALTFYDEEEGSSTPYQQQANGKGKQTFAQLKAEMEHMALLRDQHRRSETAKLMYNRFGAGFADHSAMSLVVNVSSASAALDLSEPAFGNDRSGWERDVSALLLKQRALERAAATGGEAHALSTDSDINLASSSSAPAITVVTNWDKMLAAASRHTQYVSTTGGDALGVDADEVSTIMANARRDADRRVSILQQRERRTKKMQLQEEREVNRSANIEQEYQRLEATMGWKGSSAADGGDDDAEDENAAHQQFMHSVEARRYSKEDLMKMALAAVDSKEDSDKRAAASGKRQKKSTAIATNSEKAAKKSQYRSKEEKKKRRHSGGDHDSDIDADNGGNANTYSIEYEALERDTLQKERIIEIRRQKAAEKEQKRLAKLLLQQMENDDEDGEAQLLSDKAAKKKRDRDADDDEGADEHVSSKTARRQEKSEKKKKDKKHKKRDREETDGENVTEPQDDPQDEYFYTQGEDGKVYYCQGTEASGYQYTLVEDEAEAAEALSALEAAAAALAPANEIDETLLVNHTASFPEEGAAETYQATLDVRGSFE